MRRLNHLADFHAAGFDSWVNAPDSDFKGEGLLGAGAALTDQTHPDRILEFPEPDAVFHLALIHQRAGPDGGREVKFLLFNGVQNVGGLKSIHIAGKTGFGKAGASVVICFL
ncbi:Uncharacterised protein [Escherichia coli]|nr:Uncharacterised protein [Escherichia coli]